MSELSLKPGLILGSYPQRVESGLNDVEQAVSNWIDRQGTRLKRNRYSQKYIVGKVERYAGTLSHCSEEALDALLQELRIRLRSQGLREALIIESFAIIREVATRTIGKRHYDNQLYGGWLIMNGMLAEMQTGEGKTLTATLPACTAALAGIPVHVITANDYLAARDCELMRPLYQRLQISAAAVISGMEAPQCRQAYEADVVHTTNKQVAFDYLRDRIEIGEDTGDLRFQYRQIQHRREPDSEGRLLLRGLCFAIVDEADSVLIDEANTPLIITQSLPNEDSPDTYSDALYLASTLLEDRHFKTDFKTRTIEMTAAGEEALEELIENLPDLWRNKNRRDRLVKQALAANYFYRLDHEYIVTDGRVQIIDQSTGRVMADRSWEQGLHQMIETKEGCLVTEQREPQARISYQKFFSRYLRLGGTSGTISEVGAEMHRVYGLDVFEVANNRPSKREMYGERLFLDLVDKALALTSRVEELQKTGRPILIGTCAVEDSEQVSGWLQQLEIEHRVLNARQDQQEAEIIAAAGQKGAITVATNMAGRGTDIELGPGVAELGGLHVISLSLNASRRIDRQLYGRCARQGDPGSAEAILSLEDAPLTQYFTPTVLGWLARLGDKGKPVPAAVSRVVLRLPQFNHELRQRRMRKALMKQDKRLRRILAFAGRFE